MRKLILVIASLSLILVLASLAIAAGSQVAPENIQSSVTLHKGWNLVTPFVALNAFSSVENSNELSAKNIRAVFFYDRYAGQYIRIAPDLEMSKLESFTQNMGDPENGGDIKEYGGFTNSAIWVYSDVEQEWEFTTVDGPLYLNYVNLKSGWNFLSITPEMVGKQLKNIKGTCNLQKAYVYDSQNQEWQTEPVNDVGNDNIFPESFLWNGMAIKVAGDCVLGNANSTIVPPTLPPSDDTSTPSNSTGLSPSIGTYVLNNTHREGNQCSGNLCMEGYAGEYRDSQSSNVVFVGLWKITSGSASDVKSLYAGANGGSLESVTVSGNTLYRVEKHELIWFTGLEYPAVVFTQEGSITYASDGTYSYDYGTASGANAVTSKLLGAYPSQEVN